MKPPAPTVRGATRRRALLAVLISALFTAPALAQGIDLSHGGPIDITAQNGIEWLQNQHEVIATGNAHAVRQNVTVIADRLIAFYRKKAGAGAQAPATAQPAAAQGATTASPDVPGEDDTSGNEVYRVEADGHVQIFTATDHATADKAVYDLDKAVVVLTGHNLRITTPNDIITARDDLEYWSQQHMAVARGNAVLITKDSRRVDADVLVAYTKPDNQAPPQPAPTTAQATNPQAQSDPLAQTGKLEKADAFGHVSVRTPTDIVTGDRGVYVPDTGIAVLVGNVRITRGQNQLAGSEAIVNLKTNVSRLVSGGAGPVQGLIVPNDNTNRSLAAPSPGAATNPPKGNGGRS
jgi:lipopolysaccharide export system protein LptA